MNSFRPGNKSSQSSCCHKFLTGHSPADYALHKTHLLMVFQSGTGFPKELPVKTSPRKKAAGCRLMRSRYYMLSLILVFLNADFALSSENLSEYGFRICGWGRTNPQSISHFPSLYLREYVSKQRHK